METQAILEQFAMLTGLDERQAGQYRPLCENARAQVLGIAKPNVGMTGDMALCSAAAALAFTVGYYCGLRQGQRMPSQSEMFEWTRAQWMWRQLGNSGGNRRPLRHHIYATQHFCSSRYRGLNDD